MVVVCMDFSKIKNSIIDTSRKWKQKVVQAGKKTLRFTGEQLASTGLFLADEETYDRVLQDKRVVLIAFDEDDDVASDVILLMPVWASKAFTDIVTLKYLNRETSGGLITAK